MIALPSGYDSPQRMVGVKMAGPGSRKWTGPREDEKRNVFGGRMRGLGDYRIPSFRVTRPLPSVSFRLALRLVLDCQGV